MIDEQAEEILKENLKYAIENVSLTSEDDEVNDAALMEMISNLQRSAYMLGFSENGSPSADQEGVFISDKQAASLLTRLL